MKTCKAENCVNPVFGGGYCNWHQHKRTDKKPKKPAFKRSEPRQVSIPTFGFEDQTSMFLWLWEAAMDEYGYVYCKFTGKRLNGYFGSDLWFNCFAHILPKKNYTYFKLNPNNIAICHPDFHKIVDSGTLKDRQEHPEWKWDLWDAEVIRMKKEYKQFKLKNLLR